MIRSLSVVLDELEQRARSVVVVEHAAKPKAGLKLNVEFLPRIIESLYRRYFGERIPPGIMRGKVAGNVIATLRETLAVEKIDPVTWVTAQFHCVTHTSIGANPYSRLNLLLPKDDGRRRYNAFVLHSNLRLHHASEASFAGRSLFMRFVDTVSSDEEDIADVFVSWHRRGEPQPWELAVEMVQPGKDWLALQGADASRKAKLVEQYGRKRVELAGEIAQLRAACNIAGLLSPSLPHKIGMNGTFEWNDFASFLADLYPCHETLVGAGAVVFGADLLNVRLSDEEMDS